MKKLLLILCLLSITAHAEWKLDGQADTFKAYIDYSRIKTEGQYISMWVLYDFNSPKSSSSGNQYLSETWKKVIDCQGSRLQSVAKYFYSEQMGKGAVVDSGNYQIKESDWQNPPPNSFNEGFIKIACVQTQTPPPVIAPITPKPSVNNAQDTKRQKCIRLGLAPGSVDFQQCMN
jgi:hypothetical protein